MSKPVVVTARVTAEIAARLDALAEKLGKSRAAIIGDAIRDYAEEQTAFFDFIEEGDRDIREGHTYNYEEIQAWFAKEIAVAHAAMAEKAKAA